MTTDQFARVAVPARELDLTLLGGHPDDPALVTGDRTVTYAELAALVQRRALELDDPGRLLLLEMANDLPSVVTYLAALALHRPVVIATPGAHDDIARTYRPALDADAPPPLHPDLAVLLSTSGSTGSPKLVRLSRANVVANARSIADYLGIRRSDRALTSLPLHYCYGLSVLNSHLVAGAAVVLTDLSVADECFWDLARTHRATTFAGVPYTFDLLDATGFADRDLPHLRYVTQAGGRLAPETVVRYAELGQRRGWDLFVMYGQTEATARMAYLPPTLAPTRPEAIGVAVPGGTLRVDLDGPGREGLPADVGELVYGGPNVMMGYAHGPADLARGAELTELRTGDLARRGPDGLWEVVGRLNRTAKVFGLRLDLDRIERRLATAGAPARAVVVGEGLHLFTTRPRDRRVLPTHLARIAGIPAGTVTAHVVETVPTTASGKCDYAALRRQAEAALALAEPDAGSEAAPAYGDVTGLRDLYAVLLGRPDATAQDTFVGLGGDSLSFVELSTRLAARIGHLPADWPHRSIESLALESRPARRFTTPVELGVVLRAVAIILIVVTHVDVVHLLGGAHVLLALVGYHLARFGLAVDGRRTRTRRLLVGLAGVAVPASLWIGGAALLTGEYRPATALYLNGVVGESRWSDDWQFWFLDVLVWGTLAVALALAVPWVDRRQRRSPYAVALVALVAALGLRYATVGVSADLTEKYTVAGSLWLIALGWAVAEARTRTQRLVVAAVAALGLVGFFPGEPSRTAIVGIGVLLLLWARPVPVPTVLAAPLRVVAGASLWIYLTQWQVYPGLEAAGRPALAIGASLAVGVACCCAYTRLERAVRPRLSRRRRG
ncbi:MULTISPECIES: AMP-binding protein [unclassified Nocardioides]|uniref:AMP-binding protein n=1 Tax=unclassified Nocardioides TaxID=2615069 RepID=UPI0000570641|nr:MULTISPECIES: AMP-binding protein [unclassified Nocardioides]ABL81529.1 AMP-dependent synthetase and ligase [Nocardioides sp. JS614]